nr:reverse transcriptase domain-containing protein [Tanacetum cinerariifolium]
RPSGFAQPNVQKRFGQPQGFNRGNNFNPEQSYQAPTQQNQIVPLNELEKVKRINEANIKAMQTQINMVKNKLRNEMKISIQASLLNQTNEIKNMMASLFQMNTTSTSGSGSLPSNTVANPKGEFKAITTRNGRVLDGPTVPTPPLFINLELHINITLADALILMPKYQKMLIALLSNKEKLQELANTPLNKNYSAVILKKLPEKLRDPGKFLIPCSFSELKCKTLADLGASINLMPLCVWKKLGLLKLISTCMTLELANRAICTTAGLTSDVFVSVSKFTFPADFVIVDFESDPRVPLILGRPFLRTARALIDVHGEEMILRDVPLNPLLEELADELTLITFPLEYDDDLQFDVESDLKKIEFLLHQDIDSSLKDSINQSNLAGHFVDSMPEMFTDEHALDYSSSPIFDEYDDDFLEVESDTENVYDDPFDSKREKIKESKLLIYELDLPCDFLPSDWPHLMLEDFDPPFYEPLFFKEVLRVDALPSTNNEDKVFNPGNLNRYNEVQNVRNQIAQNPRVQNVGNQNGLIDVQENGIQNQIGNGNLVAYTELLEPIPETQVPQTDNNVISEVTDVEQGIVSNFGAVAGEVCAIIVGVPFCDNSPSLDVLNDHFEIFSDFTDDCTLSDDDSFKDIDYIEASPPDSELVSLEEHAFREKHHQSKDIQELLRKLLNDLQITSEKLAEYINLPSWNRPAFYEDDDDDTTTHAYYSLPEYDSFLFEIEPDQSDLTSIVMKDILREPHVHVPNVLPTYLTLMLDSNFIPSDDSLGSDLEVSFSFGTRNKIFDPRIFFEVQSKRFLSRDTFSISFIHNLHCPVIETMLPFCPKMKTKFSIMLFFDFNDDCTSSDDDSFENIEYVEASPPDSELVGLEDVKDEILFEKLLNVNLLIAKIESLNDNPTLDCVLKSLSLFPILVEDSDSFFEKSDTSLSYSDNSLPKFKTFS